MVKKEHELKQICRSRALLIFLCLFAVYLQAMTVTAVMAIVKPEFSEICLPHPSTAASLMFCWFAKFSPKQKTWGRSRQRPAMTDFQRKVNKCDPLLSLKAIIANHNRTAKFLRWQQPNRYLTSRHSNRTWRIFEVPVKVSSGSWCNGGAFQWTSKQRGTKHLAVIN